MERLTWPAPCRSAICVAAPPLVVLSEMIALAPDVRDVQEVSKRRLRAVPRRRGQRGAEVQQVAILQHIAEHVVETVSGARHDDRVVAAAVVQRVAPPPALIVFPLPPKLIVSLPAPVVICVAAQEACTVSVPPVAVIVSPEPPMKIMWLPAVAVMIVLLTSSVGSAFVAAMAMVGFGGHRHADGLVLARPAWSHTLTEIESVPALLPRYRTASPDRR